MLLRRRLATIVSLASVLIVSSGPARAELGRDVHIQKSGEIRIEVDRQVYEEFARLFELGYPPATVMMHAVSAGMSINDILYIAVRSDPERAGEYYDTAASLLPALPGWVCQGDSERARYTREVDLAELDDRPTIREIAGLFFEQNRKVVPFPDWTEGRVHMEASIAELSELVSDEQWYTPGDDDGTPRTAPNRPIFVALYKHNGGIVVDNGGVERIRRARERGVERLPVVLVYNDVSQRAISQFSEDVTARELAESFYDQGIELTAVPEWRVGDFHAMTTVEELRQVVEIPAIEDIPEARRTALEEMLLNAGPEGPEPVLLTLVRSGQGRAWVNDPAKVAVAGELGVEEVPMVMFYHRLDRRPCGASSNCEDLLCQAATAAGASPDVCDGSGQQSANAGGTRAPVEPAAAGHPVQIGSTIYQGLDYTQNQCRS